MRPDSVIQGPIGIIADDLTGANDTGAQFSRQGGSVLVLLSLERSPPRIADGWDAIVLNTGSRNISLAGARHRMAQAMARLEAYGAPLLYEKIDSTLRGNWAGELEVALERRRGPAFLAPAFPLNGRTVEGGSLFVRGTPLELSEAARDSLAPVRSGRIVELLGETLSRSTRRIGLETLSRGVAAVRERARQAIGEGARVLVCDARDQSDLATLAEAAWPLLPDALMAGSAGLARELAERQAFESAGLERQAVERTGPERRPVESAAAPPTGPVLVVAGSRSQVTAEQVACLVREARPSQAEIDPATVDGSWDESRRARLADALVAAVRSDGGNGVWLVTIGGRSEGGGAQYQLRSARLNSLLGEVALRAVNAGPLAGIVLTGGDVAASVLESLLAVGVRLGAEILPGIPLGTIVGGPREGLGLVTKAGAFGPPDALVEAVGALTRRANSQSAENKSFGKAVR
jgi:uncharacterized protein YgbK (DUF1537 family)